METKPVQLAIVGGGAAGLFAAAVAAERRLPCVLLERKARLGSKVLMTANGRCNFTKDISADQFLRDLACGTARDGMVRFVAEAIRECPPRQIVAGFKSLGVPLRRMPDGRMFPADGKAATILHAFGDLLRDEEVPILTNGPVTAIRATGHAGARFVVSTRNFDILAENVLLATGGVSYPKTGSVGDGQNFARALGHTLVPYRPGLIGLETDDPRVTRLAGRRFEDDGRVKILSPTGQVLFDYRGEVDCERFGLSGAAIYNAQRFLEHCHHTSQTSPTSQTSRTSQTFQTSRTSQTFQTSQTPKPPKLSKPSEPPSLEVWFGHNRLTFAGLTPRPVKEAIVTLGGVLTDEIDPHTMQSKLVPGLYFAGEMMDIDGPTGGYNLTLAFATARKAVTSICSSRAHKKTSN